MLRGPPLYDWEPALVTSILFSQVSACGPYPCCQSPETVSWHVAGPIGPTRLTRTSRAVPSTNLHTGVDLDPTDESGCPSGTPKDRAILTRIEPRTFRSVSPTLKEWPISVDAWEYLQQEGRDSAVVVDVDELHWALAHMHGSLGGDRKGRGVDDAKLCGLMNAGPRTRWHILIECRLDLFWARDICIL
jgi:hypothetical protein